MPYQLEYLLSIDETDDILFVCSLFNNAFSVTQVI
jgi:hypothetical protein